jgi:glycogen synthase
MAAESTPFVKVGGLADVAHASGAGQVGQHTVRVIIHHGLIEDSRFGISYVSFDMLWNGTTTRVEVSVTEHRNSVYFVRGWPTSQAASRGSTATTRE